MIAMGAATEREAELNNIAQQALQALADIVMEQYLSRLKCNLLPELIGVLTQIQNFPQAVHVSLVFEVFRQG